MKKFNLSVFAAALAGSTAFGGAALASGDYYPGASSEAPAAVDTFQTSSINNGPLLANDRSTVEVASQSPDHGDYYEGANRPN